MPSERTFGADDTNRGTLWPEKWKRHCFRVRTRVVGSRYFLVSFVLLVLRRYSFVSINVGIFFFFAPCSRRKGIVLDHIMCHRKDIISKRILLVTNLIFIRM